MSVDEFMNENGIAIYAEADLTAATFRIVKRDAALESYALFEQLILCQSAENLEKYLEGQPLPRLWRCGGTRCTVGRPEPDRIVALFYDSGRAAAEDYRFALKLDAELREIPSLCASYCEDKRWT